MKLEGLKSPVSIFMNTKIAEVKEDDNFLDVIDAMVKRKTDIVLVKNDSAMIGIITSTDIFKTIAECQNFEKFTIKVNVKNFMTSCELNGENSCLQISSEETVENAMKVMAKSGIHHLVVIDIKGKIIGTISSSDIIKALKVIRW